MYVRVFYFSDDVTTLSSVPISGGYSSGGKPTAVLPPPEINAKKFPV